MVGCPHIDQADIHPPDATQPVYREDCTQCFDSIDDPAGLNVCLSCFNGGCAGDRNHANLHNLRTGHPLALNIKRTQRKIQRNEPPQKMSKLAIAAEIEEDHYDTATTVVCYSCQKDNVDELAGKLPAVVDGVMKALTFSKREEVKAWEQEFVPCEHTLCLTQGGHRSIGPLDLNQCSMCDLRENLWICLECGNIGCGRSQFGGVGGNSHALAHADSSSHCVAVKLGSITPEGAADVYCYTCNEERTDPDLAAHLAHWEINIADREKTEKSLMEMQIEHNLRWEFVMTSENGHELTPIFGPGFTGLKNLGNSCYLSSIIQCLFSLPEFQRRYYYPDEEPPLARFPAEDFETQMRKLADGLLSGRYSQPDTDVIYVPSSDTLHQRGLAAHMFKHLIGRGHPEFSTMRQQDAFELLLHLFKLTSLSKHPRHLVNPINAFRFMLEQRLQCISCERVRYKIDEQDNISIQVPARPSAGVGIAGNDSPNDNELYETVTLKECLDEFTAEETVELRCPACDSKNGFRKRSRFKTLPQEFVINARRFKLVNWVPTKLNIPVEVGNGQLDLTPYLSSGQQPSEELLLDKPEHASRTFVANQALLKQLLSMGFPQVRCEKALQATGNSDLENAMNWVFGHMDDPNIDESIAFSHVGEGQMSQHDPAKIAQLGEMGINANRAREALAATGEDVNRALDWVFSHPDDIDAENNEIEQLSDLTGVQGLPGTDEVPAKYQLRSIVCHKGSSVHAGHYVAFTYNKIPGDSEPSWLLFNDEKVVKIDNVEEMKQYAYVYFFSRL